jgi:hypothetical protein
MPAFHAIALVYLRSGETAETKPAHTLFEFEILPAVKGRLVWGGGGGGGGPTNGKIWIRLVIV